MNTIKLLLYRLLGLEKYLRIVSRIYIFLMDHNFGKKKYPEIHYLKTIVKPGFHCVDIGANLGYFSYFLSKYAGANGKVFAVEPIPLFGGIWKRNVARTGFNNCQLLPYALGAEEKTVEMGMPTVDGAIHHGMTKVIDNKQQDSFEKTFEVSMKVPDELFSSLEKIDFLKIDIEGYEQYAFAHMKTVLEKHHPLIQAELGGEENRRICCDILFSLGYTPKILDGNTLVSIPASDVNNYKQDLYFSA